MKITNYKNQKVGVLGLGEENIALVKFLVKEGTKVVVCDQKSREELGEYYQQIKDLPIQFRLGPHYLDHLEDFAAVFRTPGLPYLDKKIQKAQLAGVEISSGTKLFFDLCPSPIIGVTGTKGKGTTASLIYEILSWKSEILNPKSQTNSKSQNTKSKIYLGGNIGNPPIEFLDKLTQDDIVVLELSSFQLHDLKKSPHIAVVLDIKVDHLDYHQNEKEYIEAKKNIVRYQGKNDFAVINADYLTSFEFAVLTRGEVFYFSRRKSVDQGAYVNGDKKIILRSALGDDIEIMAAEKTQLRGEHNLENILAAVTASYLAGAKIEAIKKALALFKGLEHRLEFIKEINGIRYYNDSFSTTPDTTIAAINSFREPIILLLGGSEKNADYRHLGQVISNSSVKAIIAIGLTAQRIIKEVKKVKIEIIEEIKLMPEAIKIAREIGRPGDVVLLSPASASFDRFKNYKERGNIFKQVVLESK